MTRAHGKIYDSILTTMGRHTACPLPSDHKGVPADLLLSKLGFFKSLRSDSRTIGINMLREPGSVRRAETRELSLNRPLVNTGDWPWLFAAGRWL